MSRNRRSRIPVKNDQVTTQAVARQEVIIPSKLENDNVFASAIGIGGGINPWGFPGNQGAPGTNTIEQAGTIFKNLRYYLVSNFRQLLNQAYAEIGLIQTICDVPVDDALRGGITLKTEQLDETQIKDLMDSLDRDDDLTIIGQAAKWNRLFGGAGVMILTDQDPEEPLEVDTLTEDEAFELRAVDMWELFWNVQNTDGFDPTIQEEEFEHYNYYGIRVHKSRVMRLKGITPPSFIRPRLRGWGLSVVESLVRSLNQYLKATDLAFEVLDEFKVDVYKIKNLVTTLMSPGGAEQVKKRIQLANWEKNYNNALTMDSEDDWDHKQLSFAGLGDAMLQIRMQVASDMRMPLTKLFGISAAGFNSGEDDIEVYNAMVESQVRNKIKYIILRVIELKCQRKFGFIPDDLSMTFQPLRVMSSEQEENVKTQKFTRAMQALQSGAISLEEFRDECNKAELFEITLSDSELSLLSGIDDGADDSGTDSPNGDEDTDKPNADSEKPTAASKSGASKDPPKAKPTMTKKAKDAKEEPKTKDKVKNWEESKHPRDDDGKFGEGGGGKSSDDSSGSSSSDLGTLSKTLDKIKKTDKPLASAAYEWSRAGYHQVQMIQRGMGGNLSPESKEIGEKITKELDRGWDDLPSHKGKIVRDINIELSDVADTFKVGGTFETDSYTSFTAADSYLTKRKVRIQVSESSKGKYIADLCQDKNEEEVLIPKGTKYKIERIEECDDRPYFIIHVKEL